MPRSPYPFWIRLAAFTAVWVEPYNLLTAMGYHAAPHPVEVVTSPQPRTDEEWAKLFSTRPNQQ